MRVAFVMPAYDEEALLETSVDAVIGTMDELVIVNDGSRDRTGAIADAIARRYPEKVHVLHRPKNGGIGAAVKTGLRALLDRQGESRADAIGIIGSDNQFEPAVIPKFRRVLETFSDVDVAKGSRFLHPESLGEMPRFRYWGNRGVSTMMQLALGYWGMSDVLHGYLLARTAVFERMDLDAVADGYDLENTMMAEFRRLEATFALVPSPSRYADEVSKIVYRKQIPRTISRFTGIVAQRMSAGPGRLGLTLLLAAIPTLGATLPLAILVMKKTSPSVRTIID
jgi:glycosyltransferase involved in cell wall biosynthesis